MSPLQKTFHLVPGSPLRKALYLLPCSQPQHSLVSFGEVFYGNQSFSQRLFLISDLSYKKACCNNLRLVFYLVLYILAEVLVKNEVKWF